MGGGLMVIDREVLELAERLRCDVEEAHLILTRNLSQEGRGHRREPIEEAPVRHRPQPYQPYWV